MSEHQQPTTQSEGRPTLRPHTHLKESYQICDYCGERIKSDPQKCMAQDDGWCRP